MSSNFISISCLAIDFTIFSLIILSFSFLKYGGLHVIKSNVSVSNIFIIFLAFSLYNFILLSRLFIFNVSNAKSYISFCNSTAYISAEVFVLNTSGIGKFPLQRSIIFFVFGVNKAKFGSNIESKLKLK